MVEIEIDRENNVEIVSSYFRSFQWREEQPGSGFAFACDKMGNIEDSVFPEAKENFAKCLDGTYDVIDEGVKVFQERNRLCDCGSLEKRTPIYDARGLFVIYVCSKCRNLKLLKYRSDIFTDPNYWTCEPIEEE